MGGAECAGCEMPGATHKEDHADKIVREVSRSTVGGGRYYSQRGPWYNGSGRPCWVGGGAYYSQRGR